MNFWKWIRIIIFSSRQTQDGDFEQEDDLHTYKDEIFGFKFNHFLGICIYL